MAFTALPAATPLTSLGVATGIGTGVAPDSVNGNTFANDGKKLLSVYNGNAGSLTVTITAFPAGSSGAKPDGLTVNNQVITIPTLTGKIIGPFKQSIYNDAGNLVEVAWSLSASVTALVLDATPNP